MSTLATLALSIPWDPTLRGILVVVVGVGILVGSVYLLLGTNVGARLGFLITGAAFFGWMAIMAIAWWVYGIGWVGDSPTWSVREIHVSQAPDELDGAATEAARSLQGWDEIPEGDPSRGEAEAAADEALTHGDIAQFETSQDYVVIDAFETGGKGDSFADTWLPLPHPTHYALVQAQPVMEVEVEFGETPPPAEPDTSAQVFSVVMERDLGNERLPPFIVMVTSLILFAIFCNVLHHREKLVLENRAKAETTT
jgi:hypothetical protein